MFVIYLLLININLPNHASSQVPRCLSEIVSQRLADIDAAIKSSPKPVDISSIATERQRALLQEKNNILKAQIYFLKNKQTKLINAWNAQATESIIRALPPHLRLQAQASEMIYDFATPVLDTRATSPV